MRFIDGEWRNDDPAGSPVSPVAKHQEGAFGYGMATGEMRAIGGVGTPVLPVHIPDDLGSDSGALGQGICARIGQVAVGLSL